MERIQRLTRHTAELWFNKGREFYIVPAYQNGKLSKGELVDSKVKDKFRSWDEFLYDFRGKISYYNDPAKAVEFYHIY